MEFHKSYSFWIILVSVLVALIGVITSDEDWIFRTVALVGIPLSVAEICKFFQGKDMCMPGVVAHPDEKLYRFVALFFNAVLLFGVLLVLYQ